MGRKSLKQHYYERLATYYENESWRQQKYSGYVEGTYVEQFAWRDDFIKTIFEPKYVTSYDEDDNQIVTREVVVHDIEGDSNPTLRRKIAILDELNMKTKQKMINVGSRGKTEYVSERILKEADKALSQINLETFKLTNAYENATSTYKAKDENGNKVMKGFIYEQHPYLLADLDLPFLPGGKLIQLPSGLTIGNKVPKWLSVEEQAKYQKFLSNRKILPKTLISDISTLKRYGKLFRGGKYDVTHKNRLMEMKKSYYSAYFGINSFYQREMKDYLSPSGVAFMEKLKRRFSRLSKKDVLFLSFTRSDLLNFDFVYSANEFLAYMSNVSSAIERLDIVKQSKDSDEYEIYQNFITSLGSYYD